MNGPTSIQSHSPDWRHTHTHNSTRPPVSLSEIPASFRPTGDIKTIAPPPSLPNLDIAKIRRDAQEHSNDSKHASPVTYSTPSAMSMNSPMSGYPGPPPPYSSCIAPTTAASTGHTEHQPRPMGEPQRLQEEDEKRARPSLPSLPSIHEALGKDSSTLYQGPPPHHPVSAPSQRPSSLSTISPTTPIQQFHANSFSSSQILNPYKPQSSGSSHPPPTRPVLDTFRTVSQPIDTQRYGAEPQSASSVLTSPRTITTTRSQPQSHPTTPAYFKPINSHHPPTGPTSQPHSAPYPPAYSYPPPSSYANQVSPSDAWRGDDYSRRDYKRPEDPRPSSPRARPPIDGKGGPYNHGESVKRHLETFDLELGLNEIAEASTRTLDFARKYVDKAHNMHRSGIETALPTLAECDDMQHLQQSILHAMERIRDIVVTQQHALAEQRSREEANKVRQTMYQEQNNMYNKDEGSGGFAGSDPKKRRGRHAPPGRCHSCARSETPEWRRGPDGARTLCNACGLHYAKLTRKLGPNATLPSSNLRPRDDAPSAT